MHGNRLLEHVLLAVRQHRRVSEAVNLFNLVGGAGILLAENRRREAMPNRTALKVKCPIRALSLGVLVGHVDGFLQVNIRRGTARLEFDLSGFDHESAFGFVPIGQRLRQQNEFDRFPLAGLQGHALETAQLPNGAFDGGVQMFDVELNDLFAGPVAGVFHVHTDRDRTILGQRRGAGLQAGILKGRVAQAVAERTSGGLAMSWLASGQIV